MNDILPNGPGLKRGSYNNLDRARGGFTLLEALFVVAIIGMISSIAIPTYNTMVYKVRQSEGVFLIDRVVKAQLQFFSTPRIGTAGQSRTPCYLTASGGIDNFWGPSPASWVSATPSWDQLHMVNVLGVTVDKPVYYWLNATSSADHVPPSKAVCGFNWRDYTRNGPPANGIHMTITARGDLDGDRRPDVYASDCYHTQLRATLGFQNRTPVSIGPTPLMFKEAPEYCAITYWP